jgi:hypothetical protein
MIEAKIRTQFGEISISFQSTDELKVALQDLEQQISIIQEAVRKFAPPPPRTAKPGYESAYRFTPNGDIELLHRPQKRPARVALVLYAYDPQHLSIPEIERLAGIRGVYDVVLKLKQNKRYFQKFDDKWGLAPDGYTLVEKIGAGLARSKEVTPKPVSPTEAESVK